MSAEMEKKADHRRYAVIELQVEGKSEWDAFIENTEGGTFYHRYAWKTLIENQLDHSAHYLLCQSENQIKAILPLVHVKSLLFGNALISLPFLVYGGPVAEDKEAEYLLLEEAKRLGEKLGVDYVEIRSQRPLAGNWHVRKSHVTFRKAIASDPEQNLAEIPRKQRAMIRKGIKEGLQAEIDTDVGRLYSSLLVCKRNLGTPFFGEPWLRAIKEEFGNDAEILTVTRNKDVVCSVMSFKFRNQILPYYGGGGDVARQLKGNDFMYWSVMEKACREGFEVFDYGRSLKDSGAYRFKKHWGFEPEPLFNQYHLVGVDVSPNLTVANRKYELAIKAWQKLPLWAAELLGPPLAKRLG